MLSKNRIKNINQLHQKKFRKELRLFLAEGPKVVEELLGSGIKTEEVFGVKKWIDKHASLLKRAGCIVEEITETELARISGLQTPNEVLAICRQPAPNLKDIDTKISLFLYLDGITDPGNMGTIIRMAEWFGLKQLFLSTASAEVFNPKVVQSTMGSIARVQCFYLALPELLKVTGKIDVLGADLNGENIYRIKPAQQNVLVIGSESHGISEPVREILTKSVSIPAAGTAGAESLNAAVATSVILSELFRKSHFAQ